MTFILEFFEHLMDTTLSASPWVLLGLLVAGVVQGLIPADAMRRWLGGRGMWPAAKAAVIGTPLPLCSCGVLPAAVGLRRAGASKGATVSFLIATPENGMDSIALSYSLLGPFLTVARVCAAVASAVLSGILCDAFGHGSTTTPGVESDVAQTDCRVCSPAAQGSKVSKLTGGLRFAMTELLDDLKYWIGLGVVLAALINTVVPPNTLASWGSGLPAMLGMLVVGIPMYICASASTPVAASLITAGVSPGTTLVFLLAGPATNLATVAALRQELGGKSVVVYLSGIALGAVLSGLLVDRLIALWGINIAAEIGKHGQIVPIWLAVVSAVALVFASIPRFRSLMSQG